MNWAYGIGIFANNDIRSDNDLTIKQFYNRRNFNSCCLHCKSRLSPISWGYCFVGGNPLLWPTHQ